MNRAIVLVALLAAVAWPSPRAPLSDQIPVWLHNETGEAVALEVAVYDPQNREAMKAARLIGPFGAEHAGNFTTAEGDWAITVTTVGRANNVRLFEGNLEARPGDAWRIEWTTDQTIVRTTGTAADMPER